MVDGERRAFADFGRKIVKRVRKRCLDAAAKLKISGYSICD